MSMHSDDDGLTQQITGRARSPWSSTCGNRGTGDATS
jgi:hypothetical protein